MEFEHRVGAPDARFQLGLLALQLGDATITGVRGGLRDGPSSLALAAQFAPVTRGALREYHEDRGEAQASGDDDAVQQLDDLLEFAEDRVVEIKKARNARAAPKPPAARAEPAPETRRAATEPVVVQRATSQPVRVEGHLPERPHRRERDEATEIAAKQDAAEKAAAEQAAAESNRRDDEELRDLRERASKAEARRIAAEAQTARLKAQQQQAAAEHERERRQRVKERAAKATKEQERAADAAEAAARAAAQGVPEVAAMPAPIAPMPEGQRHASAARHPRPVGAPLELTLIARLFEEQLAEVGLAARAPAPSAPKRASVATQPAPSAAAQVSPTPSPPAADPLDDLPSLTGADLTSFRNWLGVSQRALAAKLAVEQSTISKGEGRPTTVLPPQLRKALHQAMGEPRPDAGGAP